MGLKLEDLRKLDEILKEATDEDVMLMILVLQTKLMNFIVNELGSIGSALERIAGQMRM